MDEQRVVIVGAGPVGVLTALMLARRGIPSLIAERYATPYGLPRAVHVDDEVFRIFQQVGIAEDFARISEPMPGMRLLDAEYGVMAEFTRSTDVAANGYPQANFFDQPDLEAILRDEMARSPLIELRTGLDVVGAEQTADGVLVHVVSKDGSENVAGSYLLGCDGANSTVRDVMGSSLLDLGYEERWCVVDAISDAALPVWPGMYQVCDPARATTFGRIGPRRYRWEFHLADGETAEDVVQPASLRELVAPVLGDVPFESLEVIRQAEYTFKARVADRWRQGRFFLLGDAAHLTPPFIGQGLCAGVRDAANLAWKLERVIRRGCPPTLLDTYADERKPHVQRFIRLAMVVGWAMTGGQDRAAFVRKNVLAFATRVPGFSTAVVSQAAPPLPRGPLVNRSRSFRPSSVGKLLPQPRVQDGDVEVLLDDVLGPGFAVLCSEDPAWELRYLARRLDARLVSLTPRTERAEDTHSVSDPTGTLQAWLARQHASAAVIRPDRTVLDLIPEAGPVPLSRPWLDLVEVRA